MCVNTDNIVVFIALRMAEAKEALTEMGHRFVHPTVLIAHNLTLTMTNRTGQP
jgi:hypothetical protein